MQRHVTQFKKASLLALLLIAGLCIIGYAVIWPSPCPRTLSTGSTEQQNTSISSPTLTGIIRSSFLKCDLNIYEEIADSLMCEGVFQKRRNTGACAVMMKNRCPIKQWIHISHRYHCIHKINAVDWMALPNPPDQQISTLWRTYWSYWIGPSR